MQRRTGHVTYTRGVRSYRHRLGLADTDAAAARTGYIAGFGRVPGCGGSWLATALKPSVSGAPAGAQLAKRVVNASCNPLGLMAGAPAPHHATSIDLFRSAHRPSRVSSVPSVRSCLHLLPWPSGGSMSDITPIACGMGTSWKRSPCQIAIAPRITSPSWMTTRVSPSSVISPWLQTSALPSQRSSPRCAKGQHPRASRGARTDHSPLQGLAPGRDDPAAQSRYAGLGTLLPTKTTPWVIQHYCRRLGTRLTFATSATAPHAGRLHTHSEVPITQHIKVRGTRSPYDGDRV